MVSQNGLFDIQMAAMLSLKLLLPSLGALMSPWQQSSPGMRWGPGSLQEATELVPAKGMGMVHTARQTHQTRSGRATSLSV